METPATGSIVRFTSTFTRLGRDHTQVSHGALRFLEVNELSAFLPGGGFTIAEQYDDRAGNPVADTNREIVTSARKA